jgi:alpha-beta hydrolase superfamily lysophospholipase
VAEELVSEGLAVYAVDLRGRGLSTASVITLKSSPTMKRCRNCRFVSELAGAGAPIFLLGHSAGGVVSCLFTLDHQKELAWTDLRELCYEVPAPDFALAVLKGLKSSRAPRSCAPTQE